MLVYVLCEEEIGNIFAVEPVFLLKNHKPSSTNFYKAFSGSFSEQYFLTYLRCKLIDWFLFDGEHWALIG